MEPRLVRHQQKSRSSAEPELLQRIDGDVNVTVRRLADHAFEDLS
jgi:hypothetical protein